MAASCIVVGLLLAVWAEIELLGGGAGQKEMEEGITFLAKSVLEEKLHSFTSINLKGLRLR